MSFASEIKSELLRTEVKNTCCERAELCGLILFCGAILPGGKLRISTENAGAARRGFSLIKALFGIRGELLTNTGHKGKGGTAYAISIETPGETLQILSGLSLMEAKTVSFRVRENIVEKPCCMRAFLRGAFLGGGSVANPEKEYHLEFTTPRLALAQDTVRLFSAFGLTARIVQRKASHVVYFKSSEEIGDVLNIIGASYAYMELMNVRILKEKRNQVNRRVNCESANLDKTVDAAQVQKQAIYRLQKKGKFSSMPPQLRETAEMRLAFPEAPLSEIAFLLGVSKSCINHRMRKLVELSEKA